MKQEEKEIEKKEQKFVEIGGSETQETKKKTRIENSKKIKGATEKEIKKNMEVKI